MYLSKNAEPRLVTDFWETFRHCRKLTRRASASVERAPSGRLIPRKTSVRPGPRLSSERPNVTLARGWGGHGVRTGSYPQGVLRFMHLDLPSVEFCSCAMLPMFRERIAPVDDLRFTFGGRGSF